MAANPIMVVTISVPPEKVAEFDAFYHHRFLSAMLKDSPEILAIRRYEEANISGTLRWYNKQFITIYELDSEDSVAKVDEMFARPAIVDLVREFQQWKGNHLRNFSRITYLNTWTHERKPWDCPFGSRPLFIWSHEMKPELDEQFQEWYENSYLPLQVADIPAWSACRRYTSINQEKKRRLTVFEAADNANLDRCLDDLRAGHRVAENHEWQRRVQAAVEWQDAASFHIIYRRPG
ncbi:MAG: hypothetical protein K2X81_15040 [Candidatus Obscuribacterales bacterium]|nr:hypothetical protein [Candidatus Obscuribacterales bacterium]